MQGIFAWLNWGSICLLYICIVLDLAVGVEVCKTSMLKCLGVHLSSIHRHCPRYSSGSSGMQDICAQWTVEGHMKCNGIQCIYAWLTWWSICLLYICIVLDLAVGVTVCNASVLNWLGRTYAGLHCAMLIYLVQQYSMHLCSLDSGVHLPFIYVHCPRSISGCYGMQGICAQLTEEGHM